MKATLSSAYIQTLGIQLDAVAQFAKATDIATIQEVWPRTQSVLETNGIDLKDIGSLPNGDGDIEEFQRRVLDCARPRLSKAVIMMFGEPSDFSISVLERVSLDQAEDIHVTSVLDEKAGEMFIASARLYYQLGRQFDVAHEYFTSRTVVSNELVRQMQMLFVIHGRLTDVLKFGCANQPFMVHYGVAVRDMIKPGLNEDLVSLLNSDVGRDVLINTHAITVEGVERWMTAGLMIHSTQERAIQVLKPPKLGFFKKLFGRT